MGKMKEFKKKAFEFKHNKMLIYGIKNKKVFPYSDLVFNKLRPYQIGGMPASILLFITEMNNGFCYDRSLLMQLAFKDCEIVHADVETLRVMYDEGSPEHSFVVVKDHERNKEWVVDTSMGLIYDKEYYYKFEKPKINRVISKKECMDSLEIKEIIAGDFTQDKYALPLYLPFIENCVKNSRWLGTVMYREAVLKELEIFKKAIGYDDIVKEIQEDMALMKKDPKKLDEKFKIVRDKYGREISRNGVLNPYYVSPEKVDEMNDYYESIKDDEEKLGAYFGEMIEESVEKMKIEAEKTSLIAKERLEEILENPTTNFYDLASYKRREVASQPIKRK